MVDISVKDLNKFFVIGENLLQGLSFEIQEGECVAILGRNGCGKTTLFKILTGEMDYDGGEVYVNPNKKLGLISQIPRFPEAYTVEDVLRTAFSVLTATKKKMEALEAAGRQDLIGYGKECLIRPTAGQRPPQDGRPVQRDTAGRPKSSQHAKAGAPAKRQKPAARPAGWAKPAPKKNKPARRGRT